MVSDDHLAEEDAGPSVPVQEDRPSDVEDSDEEQYAPPSAKKETVERELNGHQAEGSLAPPPHISTHEDEPASTSVSSGEGHDPVSQQQIPEPGEQAQWPASEPHMPAAPFSPPPQQPVMRSAPYTPPQAPARQQPQPQAEALPRPSDYWMHQRVQAYLYARYDIQSRSPYETVMIYGKPLSLFWWAIGTASIVGLLWYFLILLSSGFRKDKVHIQLEHDGHIFEDGRGAAHHRRRRWRLGRRWGFVGIMITLLSILLFFLLIFASAVIVENYGEVIEAAYPELTFFESAGNENISDEDIDNARVMVLVVVILFAVALIGAIIGSLMTITSYVQAAAFRVEVAPLPGFQ
jgi:hypothetical protein